MSGPRPGSGKPANGETLPGQPHRSWIERIPNAFVILFALMLLTALASWIVPPGQFERAEREGRTVVVPGSYQRLASGVALPPGNTVRPEPQHIGDVLLAPYTGFQRGAGIIFFILVVGGAFKVMDATGAVRAGIQRVVSRFASLHLVLIPVVMVLFSLAGATFGMSEETIPFVMLLVPLALALGYDSITGTAMAFVGAGAGFASAFLNPFTVQIAQGIAELPLVSGVGYRMFAWVVCTAVAIAYVMRYAVRVRRDPRGSPMFIRDQERRAAEGIGEQAAGVPAPPLTRGQQGVLWLFAVAMASIVVGVLRWGWYIPELAAVFIAFLILAGIVGRLGADGTVEAFLRGAGELVGAALVVALAYGVLVLAEGGGVIDPALHALSSGIGRVPAVMSAQLMFVVQSVLNFFVPSGSGQAALTMPLMAPLSDLVGVTRQTAVLAYQFGDGFSNMIIPTSAVLMGVLAAARIPWAVWARWILPLQLIFLFVGMALLVPPVLFGWGPH